ncbi:MAG TPA: primosomal protein N' [Chthonomonadaceae bacterium]|nr:primosomal protein N' [Chthonomonadaceae bacterium]
MRATSHQEHYTESLWEEYAEADVADVVVDIDAPDLQPSYTYRVPESLRNTLTIGACVHIPFAGREALGYVLARRKLPTTDPLCRKLKEIIALVEDAITINEEQLHAVRWMSDRYVCDLLSAIRCVAPATLGARVTTKVRLRDSDLRGSDVGGSIPQAHIIETLRALDGEAELEELRETANLPQFSGAYTALLRKGLLIEARSVARARTVEKTVKAYTLGAAAEVLSGSGGVGRRSPQQQRLLNALIEWTRRNEGPMPGDELLHAAQASSASLRGLVERGLVQVQEIALRRAPILAPEKRTVAPPLTPGQQHAVETLRQCIASGRARTVLLFGVTASGKTEVYLNAIAHTLAAGRSAIVLVPEIALTAQVVDVFTGRFGEQVAVLHSRLSEGERHDEWRRMQAGQARIVVGARSAIFAPVENVGLIVVDEEHEASYKQENTPRYNAKDLAAERARLSNAVLLLGSATPSLESYYASESPTPTLSPSPPTPYPLYPARGDGDEGRILRIEMRERIDNRPLPHVAVVDLRAEFKQRRALFSQPLVDAMAARLARKQQIILFLNRRGYAQFVLCRDCGYVARCPHCAVSLTFHAYDRSLKCHHCEYTARAPQTCPDCGGAKVKAFGIGTEKVEEEVVKVFPSARVARMDRDTTARKGAHTRIVRGFRQGEADILIGTQMVAKGLDFPNVTLVGVISADTALNMPDFRAAERTFQLLTQVAGRSGRGQNPGEVLIQTFSPDHYAIQAAVRHDYEAFYRQEILFRKELNYPPFSRFANLVCADESEARAQARAVALAAALERVTPKEVEIIGPASAPLARLKNQYRYHVALRAPTDAPLADMVRAALARLSPSDRLGLSIDMDPLSMA